MPNVVDEARRQVVLDVLATPTIATCWPTWQIAIKRVLGTNPTVQSVFDLGGALSDIFRTTGGPAPAAGGGRTQSSLSGGGHAWEGLVAWYLNLALVGTGGVVIKKRGNVPRSVRDALTVCYGTVHANTESDLVGLSFPEDSRLSQAVHGPPSALDRLGEVADERFNELSVAVIQCKTNWNDNAQIPMAWDMIYQAKAFADNRVQVGINGRHLNAVASFRYAFVTVPSNQIGAFTNKSLSVQRVSQLTGGNYWGHPSISGIAASLDNIFPRIRIGPQGGTGLRATLKTALRSYHQAYGYFGL